MHLTKNFLALRGGLFGPELGDKTWRGRVLREGVVLVGAVNTTINCKCPSELGVGLDDIRFEL